MKALVGAIPGRNGSSNFMSTMVVPYDGKMPPRLATFKNSHPPTPRATNPAIAFSFSVVYILIWNALDMSAMTSKGEFPKPMSRATCLCSNGRSSLATARINAFDSAHMFIKCWYR